MGHIVSNLVGYDRLVQDVQAVLDTLIPKVTEVQSTDGKWYTMRILPYRTIDNVIEGIVITFVDITEMKESHVLLQKAKAQIRLAVVVRDSNDAIVVHNPDGSVTAWNPAAERLFGWTEAEALTMNIRGMIPPDLLTQELENIEQLATGSTLLPYETRRLTKAGQTLAVGLTASALRDGAGRMYAIASTQRRTQEESAP